MDACSLGFAARARACFVGDGELKDGCAVVVPDADRRDKGELDAGVLAMHAVQWTEID